MVNQLACLYHERQKLYISTFNSVHLEYVFECLGEISRVLITIDAIIADNQSIAAGWLAYKRMIKYIRADPSRYGLQPEKLKSVRPLFLSSLSTPDPQHNTTRADCVLYRTANL